MSGDVIIKKVKKVSGDGHHGGAWKVAYADFVTAMMAFFLLMWLLNATSEEQRSGIADYFDPKITFKQTSGGGEGLFKGDTVFAENALAQDGTGATDERPSPERQARGESGVIPDERSDPEETRQSGGEEAERLAEIENLFRGAGGEAEEADPLLQHIRTRLTDEGLVIEIFARDGAPLFDIGSAAPTPRMAALLDMVSGVLDLVDNPLAVAGHTDAHPFIDGPQDNWTLSADRAHAARRRMTANGVDEARMRRVTGRAAAYPADEEDPFSARNRRVEITLLREPPVPAR